MKNNISNRKKKMNTKAVKICKNTRIRTFLQTGIKSILIVMLRERENESIENYTNFEYPEI